MFWEFTLIGATLPCLPLYFDRLGRSASDIAFLFAVQSFVAMMTGQIIGYLADTVFLRTRLLMVMALMGALTAALFPLLPADLAWLSLGMAGVALFLNGRVMIYNALVLDSHRGEALFGKIRLTGSLSFAVAAPVFGYLTDLPALTVFAIWPAIALLELCFAASLLFLVDRPPAQRSHRDASRISFREAQRTLFANRVLVRFLILMFGIQLIMLPGQMLQVKLLKDVGASGAFSALCLSVAAVAEAIVFAFGNRLIRKFDVIPLLAIVPLTLAVRFAMIALVPTPMMILLSNILHMITFGLAYHCAMIFLNREVPRELKSSGQTLFGIFYSYLSMLVGSISASWLLQKMMELEGLGFTELVALRWLFGIGGAGAVLVMLLWFPLRNAAARRRAGGLGEALS